MKSRVWIYPSDGTKKVVYIDKPWKNPKHSIPSWGRNEWLIPLLTKIKSDKVLYDFLFQFLEWEKVPNYGLG